VKIKGIGREGTRSEGKAMAGEGNKDVDGVRLGQLSIA
jgi:hypothetical protein